MKSLQLKVDKNDQSPLGKKQKQFNKLLQDIDSLKEAIEVLEDQMRSGMSFYHAEIRPRQREQQRVTADNIRNMHRLYDHKIFTKTDRKKIAHLITEYSGEILAAVGTGEDGEFDDIKAIFDEYNAESWDEMAEEGQKVSNVFANEFFSEMGIDLGIQPDDDMETIEEKVKAAAERKQEAEAEKKHQKPTSKKEAAQQAENLNIQKISKSIYNDLVKLLHPDREQDEVLKHEKTEAMKKVNEAWQNNDFFALLTLQSEYLHKHGDHIATLPDEQFKFYIAVLKKQKSELQEQLEIFDYMPGVEGFVYHNLVASDERSMKSLRKQTVEAEKNELKARLHNLGLSKSPESLKAAIKQYKIEQKEDFDMMELLSMMSGMSSKR